jgi:Glycosyltransferase Family 4
MNIRQITNASSAETAGGECGLTATASALAEAGHTVTLLSPAWPPAHGRSLGFDCRFFGGRASAKAPPDILHAHEPFLSGEHALLLAEKSDAPLVFTAGHRYDSPLALTDTETAALRAFIDKLGVCFANLCDAVIAPSQALAERLLEQGVTRPIHVAEEARAAAAVPSHAARLIEIYEETRRRREALRRTACRQTARLHHELVHAWACARPAACDRSGGNTLGGALADAASPC